MRSDPKTLQVASQSNERSADTLRFTAVGAQAMYTRGSAGCGMRTVKSRRYVVGIVLCAFLTQTAGAFEYPLQPESIREAYFLGRTTDTTKLTDFLNNYVHQFSRPDTGPDVDSIEFRTPYEQVVLRSREHSIGYDTLQAEKDYAAQPDLVVVRVAIFSTQTYPSLTMHPSDPNGVWKAEDFLRGFKFRVEQEHLIEPKKVVEQPICPGPDNCDFYGGYEVLLKFDGDQFAPGTANAKVTTPDGRVVQTQFDLDHLK